MIIVADDVLLVLLQHSQVDVISAACGIITNMATDLACRSAFREYGLTALLDVKDSGKEGEERERERERD